MQLKEPFFRTKMFFLTTLHNLKSLIFGGYQKLPKTISFNPFACSKNRQKDQYFADFCSEWECDLEKAMKRNKSGILVPLEEEKNEDGFIENSMNTLPVSISLKKKEDGIMIKEEKIKKSLYSRKEEEQFSKKKKNEGSYALAKRMKELEMMDVSDVEHVLDVEEALHYYSRLKSPVYLDIVDQFFTDMYREFNVPQASASMNGSKRRLGSIRL